jgi:hypothetical protein
MNVVFTGPAFDAEGASIVRADLTYAVIKRGGIVVQPRVDAATDLLVASRIDTVKASQPADNGIAIMTYPEFIATFLEGVTIPKNGAANRYVDAFRAVKATFHPDGKMLVNMDVL